MYLHLGSDFVIKNTDIIAIFNIRNQKNNVFKKSLSLISETRKTTCLKITCKSSVITINTK